MVEGNYIGTDVTGTNDMGNLLDGIDVTGSSNNTIGGTDPGAGNLISANRDGIILQPYASNLSVGSNDNLIEGNYIGTDVTGTDALAVPLGNFEAGIYIANCSGNTIGGTTAAARNLVSGNEGFGIQLALGATGNYVQGNYIGTVASGSGLDLSGDGLPFISNLQGGIVIEDPGTTGNLIGGTADGSLNVISGNQNAGVLIANNASGNLVEGNYIGPDKTGRIVIGNTGSGVELDSFASGNTIGGATAAARNIISGNLASGIILQRAAFGNSVEGNFIGTDVTGTKIPLLENTDRTQGNLQNGISFINLAYDNTIGGTVPGAGNVIAGNTGNGVDLSSGSTGNLVLGNTIGVDVTGIRELGNALNGVFINDVSGNTIGGTTPGAGNLISGNVLNGLQIAAGTGKTQTSTGGMVQGSTVEGNFIGTDASGTLAIGNGQNGVFLNGSPVNTIGGTASGAANLISGNLLNGVSFFGADTTGNLLLGNRIGTNASGTLSLGNMRDGVLLTGAPGNSLGRTEAGSGNLISGNFGNGIEINGPGATGNAVQGDFIGLDVTGTYALPNARDGVVVGESNNTIGGTSAAARNVVSGNGGNGVTVSNATGVAILGNFIGTDATGTHALGNAADGVLLDTAASNLIGGTAAGARNIISGNRVAGVEIRGSNSISNAVQSNYIGSDVTGKAALPNLVGVFLNSAPLNAIGGADPGAGNLISGNSNPQGTGVGLQILGFGATGNLVQGNTIGANASGTQPLPNNVGIFISGVSGNVIGGTTPGAGNLISGNIQANGNGVGVYITGPGATSNVVQGNLIGTDKTGTRTLVPGQSNLGILVSDTPGGNIIGGAAPGAGNVISGFTTGIYIFATQSPFSQGGSVVVQGNLIGTDVSGTKPLGNTVGIYINGVPQNTIASNTISDNNVAIYLLGSTATGNQILGNFIGLDAAGETPLGNYIGIFLDAASSNTIGGTTAGAGNFIAGNKMNGSEGSTGIYFFDGAANNTVVGNNIGTNVNGKSGRGLGMGDYGVLLFNASNNPIARSIGNNRVVGSGIANLREFTGPVTQPRSSGGGKPAQHHPHHPVHTAPRKRPSFSRLARRSHVRAR